MRIRKEKREGEENRKGIRIKLGERRGRERKHRKNEKTKTTQTNDFEA